MSIYPMIMDIVLASLLLIAIAYCGRLNGKLKALRTGNTRMVEAARELQSSVLHAEKAVATMRQSVDAAGKELQAKIDEARAMANQPLVIREAPERGRDERIGAERGRDERGSVDFTLRRRTRI
jgi:hypothetical protein